MTTSQVRDRWLIEGSGEPLGIVVYDEAGWVFHAAAPGVWGLNGKIFANVKDAEHAARELLGGRRISATAKRNAR